ncbi:hypothetical protein AWZ03_008588 [Drosophila navojoa]|uniref:Uncharacterized protein n=1 Tax=Drosophila navojoa TaxID=7232 RepID=A0A484B7Z9_DRONA|nr:hypothetical protein AWZ03_008588 [Drosophila navojoa]
MHFLTVLAMLVLIAVVLQPAPSKAEAESLAEPAATAKPDVKKQMIRTTTLSPRDLFLKHAKKTTQAAKKTPSTAATIAPGATTTPHAATDKPQAKGRPKSKGGKPAKGRPGRKNRAQCAQCASTTPVVTHMEKKKEPAPVTPVAAAQPAVNQTAAQATSVVVNQFYGDKMLKDLAMDGSAPAPVIARAAEAANLIKANLIGLESGNMTIEEANV